MSDIDLDEFTEKCYDFCVDKMGWSRHWTVGGCYLHLEASEFIESLRGKGDPEDELGDVLLVLLSVARHYNLDVKRAIKRSYAKMDAIVELGINKYKRNKGRN
jgi:hypothetical protein